MFFKTTSISQLTAREESPLTIRRFTDFNY
jgi:hypothetical protein